MSRPPSPSNPSLWLMTIWILCMGSFSACSNNSDHSSATGGTGDPGIIMAPGTGGIAFNLVWQRPTVSGAKSLFAPAFNACIDHAIDTITATVSNGTTTVASGSWPCSLHGGLLVGIPAGSSYIVQVNGMSSGPTTTIWSSLASPISVTTGQITNAGTLTMSYVGSDTAQPTVNASATGPHSNQAITTNVPATDRIDIAFSEPMAISTITTNNITLTAGSSIPGTIRYNPTNNTAAFTPSSTLAYDTQYVLQVISCVSTTCIRDTAGNQLASNHTHTFTTESAPSVAPAAPSSVTATPGNAQVTLDWLASNGSTSYNVYYSLTSGMTTSTPIPDVQPPYVHLGRTNGQAYYYVVTAVNGFGESSPSTEISATPVVPTPLPNFPSPPASLTVGVGGGGTYNTMDWPAVSDAISYNLYWSTSAIIPNKYSADNVVRGVTSPYTHTGRSPGETYCYIVTAINSSGESADSMQSCVGIGSIQLYW